MVLHPPFGSSSFKLVAKGLVELHRLGKSGNDDSPEADSIRDALDAPLDALSQKEKHRAQWLSEDLYSVSEPASGAVLIEMTAQAQQQFDEVFAALQSGDWDGALALLRRCQEYIAPALLSYLRGEIWSDAGYPEAAAMFYGYASESDPTNAHYRALHLKALDQSAPAVTPPVPAR